MRPAICIALLGTWGCTGALSGAPDAAGRRDATVDDASSRPDRASIPEDVGVWPPGAPGCGLDSAAFCETFDAISRHRGRAGDLDNRRWSCARNNPQLPTGNGATIAAGPATVTGCRADVPTRVFPDSDALICDANDAIQSSHLLVAVGAQNYGQNSYRIRQPFDFHGRTGRIAFDADAHFENLVLGWVSIAITEDPTPAPSYSIGGPNTDNDEGGAIPRNALEIHFRDNCAGRAEPGHFTVALVDVLHDFVDTTLPLDTTTCIVGQAGHLNHFEIAVSRSHVEIYGTDASADGVHFGPLQLLFAGDVDLPFERGYVHLTTHNHATLKYTEHGEFGYTTPLDAWTTRWDNVGFDGPVVGGWREYEAPDSLVMGTQAWNLHNGVVNVGYRVADEAGSPNDVIHIPDVDPSTATRASLALTGWYNLFGSPPGNWVLRYRVNGHDWIEYRLDADEIAVLTNTHSHGSTSQLLDVPVAQLVTGDNTIELTSRNVDQGYPPAVANIDLILETP